MENEKKKVESVEDVIKYGSDLGNTFLLTGMVASVVWLQNINPGVAPAFLIAGAFVVTYVRWLKKRNKPAEPCEEIGECRA